MSIASIPSDPYAYMDQNDPAMRGLIHYQETEQTSESDKQAGDAKKDMALFGEDGFGFDDFLDIINPLQHLPVISNLYREITGDELSPGARMIGGGIFGGGIGLAASVVNTAIEAQTGKDIGGHVFALFDGDEDTEQTVANKVPETEQAPLQNQGQARQAEEAAKTLPQQALAQPQKTDSPAATKASLEVSEKPKLFMGLEWKGQAPDIRNNIENLQKMQDKGLSEAQMGEIMKSIGAPAAPQNSSSQPAEATPRRPEMLRDATDAYKKQIPEAANQGLDISQSYDYLDQTI